MQSIILISLIALIIFIAIYFLIIIYHSNNNFKDILIPIISAFISLVIAIKVQNKKGIEDIEKAHFDTIKQLVIQPVIDILSHRNLELPTIDDIENFRVIESNGLNFLLCKDFLNNHQMNIKDLWRKTQKSLDELHREKSALRIKIAEEINRLIDKSMDIGYPIDQISHIKKGDTKKFEKQLISELLDGSFKENEMTIKFTQLLYPEKMEKTNLLDGFEGVLDPILNYIVIFSSTKDNDVILVKIREKLLYEIGIINQFVTKLEINKQLVDRNTLELLTELNHVKYKSKLDAQKCDFIKTN